MTASDPVSGHPDPLAALADDTEGCLCLVVGYAKRDGLLAGVTAETGKRVMMSPALGDFLQLRYVDIGPQPGRTGDWFRPARRIAGELMAVRETAGRSHFALIAIAKSATIVEGLVASCAAEPFLAGLRIRFAGIASCDDRKQGDGLVDITSSPAGSWRSERELIDVLRQWCEELPRYFAARGEPGLTRAEIGALRHGHVQPASDGAGAEGDAGARDEAPASDVLDDAPGAAEPATGREADTGMETDIVTADSTPAVPVADQRPAVSVSRWRPRTPWRRGQRAHMTGDVPSGGSAPTAAGLVYLLMIADPDADGDPALGRLQAAIVHVDQSLAAERSRGYQVRLIHGSDGDLRGELRAAGGLGRRDAKLSVKTGDFAEALKGIRNSLRRDRGSVEANAAAEGLAVGRPAVVIFTADPPMADRGAVAAFGDLAAEATVVWVVPRKLGGLVSPAFGSVVLEEHRAVPGEIIDAIHDSVLTT